MFSSLLRSSGNPKFWGKKLKKCIKTFDEKRPESIEGALPSMFHFLAPTFPQKSSSRMEFGEAPGSAAALLISSEGIRSEESPHFLNSFK